MPVTLLLTATLIRPPSFLLLVLATPQPIGALPSWLALLVWSAPLASLPPQTTVLTLLPVLYVACVTPFLVLFDVRHRRLPNVIVLPGIAVVAVCAAAAAVVAHTDPGGTALVAAVTLLVFATFRVAGALASGDVKLAVLLAAVLAPLASASLALYALAGSTAALTAGLAALALLTRARRAGGGTCRTRRTFRAHRTGRSSCTRASACHRASVRTRASACGRAAHSAPSGLQRAQTAPGATVPATAEASTRDIPLGPFLLLGFWVATTAAAFFPPT